MEPPKAKRKRKRRNTGVYVTGLPIDTDEEELAEFMTRFGGIIKKDPETRRRMVKLYKGEALVIFLRPESVQQSLALINGMEFRPGGPVLSVQRKTRPEQKMKKAVNKRIKRYDQEKAEVAVEAGGRCTLNILSVGLG